MFDFMGRIKEDGEKMIDILQTVTDEYFYSYPYILGILTAISLTIIMTTISNMLYDIEQTIKGR